MMGDNRDDSYDTVLGLAARNIIDARTGVHVH